ncbi:hypothetical protein RR48_04559 [Papilio machaon]|nr:hypothetical protein RR48_04558 [Papilio machaon]KPJ10614.1 hypothetical protein RR48_04559 [Papilio machaon]
MSEKVGLRALEPPRGALAPSETIGPYTNELVSELYPRHEREGGAACTGAPAWCPRPLGDHRPVHQRTGK